MGDVSREQTGFMGGSSACGQGIGVSDKKPGGTVEQQAFKDNMGSAGLTLIELMVAVAVTTIIMALSTLIFMAQFKSYRTGHATKTAEVDVQKALELVRDDVALAGWGVKPHMAFFIVDGGANGPDQIYVNDNSLINPQSSTHLRLLVASGEQHCGGCRRYQGGYPDSSDHAGSLDINADSNSDFADKVPVLVGSGNSTQVWVTKINGNLGALDSTTGMPAEKWVTPAVLYSVAGNATTVTSMRRTARGASGGYTVEPIAENVVDLQVIYGDNTTRPVATSDRFGDGADNNGTRYGRRGCGASCQMNPFKASDIRWADLYVVSRSAESTENPNDSTSCRPAVANRNAGNSTTCGYKYQVYVTRITPMGNVH
jgi:hypothetical protein